MTVTLLDIARSTGDDGIAALIEENIKYVPEVAFVPARTIKGSQYKATIRTTLPTAAFRNANEGAATVQSRYENRTYDCYITDTPWMVDKAVADIHEDGPAAFIGTEANAIVKAQEILLGQQMWYGNPATSGAYKSDGKGFPGLLQMFDTSKVVDAGGSTADTGSSVWAVTYGEEGLQWLYGNDSNPLQLTDVKTVVVNDSNNNPITKYHQQLLAWVGFRLGSLNGAARIKKLTADSGKGLTDLLLADLIDCFPIGYRPDALFMTKRSRTQLKKSRTPTNVKGDPVPTPTEYEGIPIIVTDSLFNTEALTL